MLNLKIKDYSRKGVVLFFCVLVVGLILRLMAIQQSATASEIAQWYFSRHLDQVFFLDSQTPVYYLVFHPSVTSLRVMIMLINFGIVGLCSWWMMLKRSFIQGLLLFSFWWLWPLHLISFELLPVMCLLVLVLWHLKPTLRPFIWWSVLSFVQSFHPFTVILVWALVGYEFLRKRVSISELRFVVSSSLPVLIYLGVKLGTFGFENFKTDVPSLHFLLFLLPLCFLVFQKRQATYQQLNGLLVVFVLYDLLVLKPWITYAGDDESVAAFKTYTSELYERPVVICATMPQQDYYFKLKHDCQFEVLKHQLAKSEFYFFDLSGNRSDLVGFLKKNAPHVVEKKFHHASFLSVTY
jgi:hypothetical protein